MGVCLLVKFVLFLSHLLRSLESKLKATFQLLDVLVGHLLYSSLQKDEFPSCSLHKVIASARLYHLVIILRTNRVLHLYKESENVITLKERKQVFLLEETIRLAGNLCKPKKMPFSSIQFHIKSQIRLKQMFTSSSKGPASSLSRQGEHQEDRGDSFAHKYLSDYSGTRGGHFGGELFKEQIESEIESVNSALATVLPQRLRLGDLLSAGLEQAEKTLEVIRSLLGQRQRDVQAKNQACASARKAQLEKSQLLQQLEKLQREMKRADNDRENLAIKLKLAEKTSKETQEKLTQEKQEISKKYKAIEARQTQYKNENRKLQATIKNLQDRISRGQEKTAFKNTFQVMHQLQNYGPTVIMMNADHEYNQLVARTMEENYLEITKENQYYKDCLISIQKELQAVLEVKREVLRRRRGYDSDLDSVFDLKQFKGELINLPQKVSKEGVTQLGENVARFKEALKLGQSLDDRENDQKLSCVSNIKNLIKNYKNVVESQEQLLGKVVLKAKEFKASEMQALESRHSRGFQEDEVQRARRFLEQQSSYLQGKNRQLQATRKAMQTTMRKVQQQREQFLRRSSQASDQMSRIKKQVQLLPSLIQQQLSNP